MGNIPTERAADIDDTRHPPLAGVAGWGRIAFRLTALFVWTMGWFVVRLSVLPVALASPARERALRQAILKTWARGVCAVVRARIAVHGPVPFPPFFLVSNHLSYFDPIVYARVLGCVFVSMAEVDTWPLVGMLARSVNTLFIDRKRRRDTARVNGEIRAVLDNGHGLLLFPESTTTYGDKVLPFHGALMQPAVELTVPVYFAAISYATAPGEDCAEHAICWVDDTPFATHALRLLRLRGFNATVTFGPAPLVDTDRKRLAASLHAAVAGLLMGTGKGQSPISQGQLGRNG